MLLAGNHTGHNHIVSAIAPMNLVDVFIIHSAASAAVDHCGSKIQAKSHATHVHFRSFPIAIVYCTLC